MGLDEFSVELNREILKLVNFLLYSDKKNIKKKTKLNKLICTATAVDVPFVHKLDWALSLLPDQCWYHWSHLEFSLCPTIPDKVLPVNNSSIYIDSKPVRWVQMALDERNPSEKKLILMVLGAVFKYFLFLQLCELAVKNKRNYHVDTGNGPLMVTPEGKLVNIPRMKCLKLDGTLVDKEHINDASVEIER